MLNDLLAGLLGGYFSWSEFSQSIIYCLEFLGGALDFHWMDVLPVGPLTEWRSQWRLSRALGWLVFLSNLGGSPWGRE